MRTITKLQTLLVLFLTTAMVCFMGCKDDDDDVPTPDVVALLPPMRLVVRSWMPATTRWLALA